MQQSPHTTWANNWCPLAHIEGCPDQAHISCLRPSRLETAPTPAVGRLTTVLFMEATPTLATTTSWRWTHSSLARHFMLLSAATAGATCLPTVAPHRSNKLCVTVSKLRKSPAD